MNQYLGKEKVPFDPDANQFDPIDPGMYLVRIEAMNSREQDTKYGKAKILNPQCRVIMGDLANKVVFGSVFVYTADDNPTPNFFADKMWVNNGYFNFIRATEAIDETALELMIGGKEMPLLTEDDIVGKICFVVTEIQEYWKNAVPKDERTEENKSVKANVQNWVAKEVGAMALQVSMEIVQKAIDSQNDLPF